MVTVDVLAAVICFSGACHPALVGPETPRGTFRLERLEVRVPKQFGGDVLMFKETQQDVFAVHRTWPGRERKYELTADRRRIITLGCINVTPEIYEELKKCCTGSEITIQ
jgi:hypothetical protein